MIRGIRLQSGAVFDFENPSLDGVTMEDIAHNLSHLCRFNGACDYFYSVAQHAVNCWRLAAPGHERATLHHDDPEGVYGDMTTWLKSLCPDYRARLEQGEDLFADWHGLPRGMAPEVKAVDLQMLALEKAALFARPQPASCFSHIADIDVTGLEAFVDLTSWTPRRAFLEFMDAHRTMEAAR
jgi:hypothetical protein